MRTQAVRRMILGVTAVIAVCSAVSSFDTGAQSPRRKPKTEEPADSIVRLIQADTLMIETIAGHDYRKVFGHPARFLHNGTYLLCDKAVWDVTGETLDAQDHVSIIQDGTTLTSDRMFYRINENLAEFRGTLVQLEDKDGNILRTKNLDYNTKDSVAVFHFGGSMKDKDGNIIESVDGTYDAKVKTFLFENEVDMFTDSVFVKTPRLLYESDRSTANFYEKVNMWQEDRMLSSRSGWYNSKSEVFFFDNNVHALTEKQEAWCDSLYVFRKTRDFQMDGHVQVLDTARSAIALAGHMNFVDSLTRLTLLKNPAIVALVENDNPSEAPDSVFIGGDTIVYVSQYRFKVDSTVALIAGERLKEVDVDPVTQLREQAAAAAREAAAKAAEEDPNNAANAAKKAQEYAAQQASQAEAFPEEEESLNLFQRIKIKTAEHKAARQQKAAAEAADSTDAADSAEVADTTAVPDIADITAAPEVTDTIALTEVTDTSALTETAGFAEVADTAAIDNVSDKFSKDLVRELAAAADTSCVAADSLSLEDSLTAKIVDSTRIAFVSAFGNVRIFRENMQVICDSLEYSDLDSLARLFNSPKIWNEVHHQYIADSVYAVVRNGAMEKAHLLSNAFVHIQEDTLHYDQIRSAEMTAYFFDDGTIRRFDALGDATALFYIQENDAFATSNHKECRMLSANFKDGEIERVHYYESVKSDATPVAQMKKEDKVIKGFAWTPEERPVSRFDITSQKVRPSERKLYVRYPKADYSFTKQYFPGYMENIHKEIRERKLLREQRERERKLAEQRKKELEALASADTTGKLATDSLAVSADSIAVKDSLAAVKDSLSAAIDSISVKVDSTTATATVDSASVAADPKAEAKAARKAAAKARADKRKQARAERDEARKEKQQLAQARWDAKEAERLKKLDAKRQARQEKLRNKKLKALRKQAETEKQDAVIRNKYINKLK